MTDFAAERFKNAAQHSQFPIDGPSHPNLTALVLWPGAAVRVTLGHWYPRPRHLASTFAQTLLRLRQHRCGPQPQPPVALGTLGRIPKRTQIRWVLSETHNPQLSFSLVSTAWVDREPVRLRENHFLRCQRLNHSWPRLDTRYRCHWLALSSAVTRTQSSTKTPLRFPSPRSVTNPQCTTPRSSSTPSGAGEANARRGRRDCGWRGFTRVRRGLFDVWKDLDMVIGGRASGSVEPLPARGTVREPPMRPDQPGDCDGHGKGPR